MKKLYDWITELALWLFIIILTFCSLSSYIRVKETHAFMRIIAEHVTENKK